MTDPKTTPAAPATPASDVEEGLEAGLLPQLSMMIRALLKSPAGGSIVRLVVMVLLVIIATAYAQVRFNGWNKPFYDAISRRDFYDFLYQLGVFFVIISALLVLNVVQRWLAEMLKLKLREGLVRGLIHDWMQPGKAIALANSGPIGINPDQRMHEDARRLCELSSDLGIGLLQATVLLVSFVGVLWVLSSGFTFHFHGRDYTLPGYMVWAAVAYAGIGSLLSYVVGGSLIRRNAERYAREADLRFSLVRVNEHLDGISLAGGEDGEEQRVQLHMTAVLTAMRRLVSGLTNLTWVTAGFGWITQVAPILVAAPLYFAGRISFGGLMMAAAAFTQAQSSLRWFVDNFSTIADWRATLLRVAAFRRALDTISESDRAHTRIQYADGDPGRIGIDKLEIVSPKGRDMIKERVVDIRPGDRVLVTAESGTDKTLLFRGLAGLWPVGSGCVTLPTEEQILFLPRGTPYLPRGTLREVLAYPSKVERFPDEAFAQVLRRLQLDRLLPMLDETHRWDRELSSDELQTLSLARVVLHTPPWVVIDGALGSLEGDALARIVDILDNELARTGVIHIGEAHARGLRFSHVLHLVKAPPKSAQPTAGEDSDQPAPHSSPIGS